MLFIAYFYTTYISFNRFLKTRKHLSTPLKILIILNFKNEK